MVRILGLSRGESDESHREMTTSRTPLTSESEDKAKMPHRTRPMTALLLFTGLNVVLVSTITPVYDFICFLPYWERRREQRYLEREAASNKSQSS